MIFRMHILQRTTEINFVQVAFAYLYTTTQFAGLGTMCTIAVDILISVTKPFRYQIYMSKKRGNVIITCLWLVPAFVLAGIALQALRFPQFEIIVIASVTVIVSIVYCILSLLFLFIFVTIYSIIVCTVKKTMLRSQSSLSRNTTKMAVTFFFVIISYFACMMSGMYIIMYFLVEFTNEGRSLNTEVLPDAVACVYISNTLLDPIIYAVRIPEIRTRYRILKHVCFCYGRKEHQEPGTIAMT